MCFGRNQDGAGTRSNNFAQVGNILIIDSNALEHLEMRNEINVRPFFDEPDNDAFV